VIAINTTSVSLENFKYYDTLKKSFKDCIVPIDMFSEKCFARLAYVIITTAKENGARVSVTKIQEVKESKQVTAETKKKVIGKEKQNSRCIII
jgi:hypothetical protein